VNKENHRPVHWRIAEQGIGGFVATAQLGFIDHIIVQQGSGVNEFDDRANR